MSTFDVDALTAPIPGDAPAGVRLPPDDRRKMETARKEFEPHPTNPSEPPVPKKPNWTEIIECATNALASKSKDLLAAVRLVEALARRDGFTGLRIGLGLLRRLTDECWDRLHPVMEDAGDLEARAGPFHWLFDANGGAWFPTAVSRLPLLMLGKQPICLRDWQIGQVDDKPLTSESLASAKPAEGVSLENVVACIEQVEAIEQILNERMGNDMAPSVAGLRDMLNECRTFLMNVQPMEDEASSPSPAGAEPQFVDRASEGTRTRAELYRTLSRVADELARMEPHSPIPDLLRWAVKLGGMSFRDLIQVLVREPAVLAEIRRQVGIKESEETRSEPEA